MNKTFNTLVVSVCVFVALLFISPSIVSASITAPISTLNNASSATVEKGVSVTAQLIATTTTGTSWNSTGYRIATTSPGTVTCDTSASFTTAGQHTNSFSMTTPNTPGTYNVYFLLYNSSSCSGSSIASATLLNGLTVNPDVTAPVIAQVTPIASPTTDNTPTYTFSSNEVGTITYSGDCVSSDTSANTGNNAITFNSLSVGAHTNCTIKVTDSSANQSNVLAVPAFTVSVPAIVTPNNKIANSSLETGSGNTATSWTADNATFVGSSTLSITSDAHSGVRAAKIEADSYTGGDAKWLFNPIVVSAGQYYTFTFWYKSTVLSQVNLVQNGSFSWVADLPVAPDWTQYSTSFFVPAGVNSLQAVAILDSMGTLTTDDYSLVLGTAPVFVQGMVSLTFDDGWKSIYTNAIPVLNAKNLKSTQYIYTGAVNGSFPDYVTPADILSMKNSGHEIGDHTRDHVSVAATSSTVLDYQINGSRTDLLGYLSTSSPLVTTFAYPYGDYDVAAESFLQGNGFAGARTVDDGYNFTNSDKYALKIKHVTNATTPAEIKSWIDTATSTKYWLILMFHRVEVSPASCVDISNLADEECTTQAVLSSVADYLSTSHTPVATVAQGLGVMNGTPLDTTAPTVTLSTTASSTTSLASIPVLATWSESVTDFSSSTSDIVITGGTITNFVGSGSTYSFIITPSADGTITVNVPGGAAKDLFNNPSTASAPFSIVSDKTKPVITLVGSSTVALTTADNYVDAGATANDNLSGNITSSIVATGLPLTTNVPGSYMVKYNVKDAAQNSADEVVRTINVSDMSAPVFSAVPADQTLEALSASGATLNYVLPTVVDDVDGPIAPTCIPESGFEFPLGNSIVSCSAEDAAGNIGSASFLVKVQDTTPPSITPPEMQNFTSEDSIITLDLVMATATDTVDVDPSITYSPHDFGFGTTTVIWTAKDFAGNEATTSSTVFVKEIIPEPEVTLNSSSSSSGRGGGGGSNLGGNRVSSIVPVVAAPQVLGAFTYNFTQTLSLGSTGNDVTELQNKLAAEGLYTGPITGYFGPITEAALKAFQSKYGLDPVGVVGPKTRAKLNAGGSVASTSNFTTGMTIDQMKALLLNLQAKLALLIEQAKKLGMQTAAVQGTQASTTP